MNTKLIGQKLAKLRQEQGLTTTELSKKAVLSQAQISRLENGKQGFRAKTLVKLAKALGVKPVYFFLDAKEMPAAKEVFENAPRYGSKRSATISRALNYPEFSRLMHDVSKCFLADKAGFRSASRLIRKALDAPREDRRDARRILGGKFIAVSKKERKKKT